MSQDITTSDSARSGPLAGYTGVELAGIGPAPFSAMLLADLGAEIIRIERISKESAAYSVEPRFDLLNRGRASIGVDLKDPEGVETVARLAGEADIFLEGFRPGVAERLGLGPETLRRRNPRLVYGRMTGWGQVGPLAQAAGHDLNYLALTGVLGALGPRSAPPPPPLNVVGDFGGGGLLLAFGIVSALLERSRSNEGQVVDAAIVDGVSLLSTFMHGARAAGQWTPERESNLVDGGAHVYHTYRTSDDRFVAVASIEERFYRALCDRLGLVREDVPGPANRDEWPRMQAELATIFAARTRDEWTTIFADVDACVTPVLTVDEAINHPHMLERQVFVEVDGVVQPASAPRFSRTPGEVRAAGTTPFEVVQALMSRLGFSKEEIDALHERGVLRPT